MNLTDRIRESKQLAASSSRWSDATILPAFMRISPLLIVIPFAGCTEWPGVSFPAGAYPPEQFSQKPALIPFGDLKFKVVAKTDEIRILLSSSRWQIVGLGVGTRNNEIILSSIAGVKDGKGGSKEHIEKRLPETPTTVVVIDPNGVRHVIGTF